MKINNKISINIFLFLYFLFAFLSIHKINSIYFYLLSFILSIYLVVKKYLRLSISIFIIMVILMPTWLLFNNIFYGRIFHYALLSDVLTALILPIIFVLINLIKKSKINLLFTVLPIIILGFYQYLAYENLIYYVSILIMIISGLNIAKTEYSKSQNSKLQIAFLIVCLLTGLFYLFDNFKVQETEKIAVLKSDWCDVSKIPSKTSHKINYYYAYSDFINILKSYGDVEIINNQDIVSKTSKYNVIILITPTMPINKEQTQKSNNSVQKGGRLV